MRKLISTLLLFFLACGMAIAQDDYTLRQIEEAQASNAESLIIGYGLTTLPPEIGTLTNLPFNDKSRTSKDLYFRLKVMTVLPSLRVTVPLITAFVPPS